MATEATFTIPSEQFPLGTVFTQLPGVTVELERIIPARDVVIPYFWVQGTNADDVAGAFSDHPGVEDIRLVDSVENDHLLRVEWAADYPGVLSVLAETDIALINGTGTDRQWTFDIRGENRRKIAEFTKRYQELGLPMTLTKMHALTPLESEVETAITEKQQDALVIAYQCGYFESPREITMEDIGEELGISQQAVASRLRRGINRILGNTFADVPSDQGE